MKIALVTDTYFPRVNGVSASTRTFAGELRRLGCEVFVYAPAYPGQDDEPGVVRFPSRYLWFDPEDRLARAQRLGHHVARLADPPRDAVSSTLPGGLPARSVRRTVFLEEGSSSTEADADNLVLWLARSGLLASGGLLIPPTS